MRVQSQIDSLLSSADFTRLDEASQIQAKENAEQCIPYFEPTPEAALSAPQKILQVLSELQDIQANISKKVEADQSAEDSEQLAIPATVKSIDELDKLITQLQDLRDKLDAGTKIHLKFK